jgi:leader peptidase (prepilin peptidase)/N-methyltransferase
MSPDLQLFLIKLIPLAFVFCFGACIGSLMNVLIYRLPLGMGVVTQPSHCPKCNTRLTWRENIPILGWLLLGGKCRFCKSKISPQYPLIEFAVALMFVLLWLQLYWIPSGSTLFGFDATGFSPEWARSGWEMTWPLYAVVALLFSGLLASTIIDARTFTIPLQIPWACTLIGVVVHTAWAAFVMYHWKGLSSYSPGSPTNPGHPWAISVPLDWPFPSGLLGVPENVVTSGIWWWVGMAFGATAGLGLSCLMLKWGWIRRSMDDYEEWEKEELARQAAVAADPAAKQDPNRVPIDPETGAPADPTQLWTLYPHARREMIKELAFLAAPVLMGVGLGALLFRLNYAPPTMTGVLAGVAPLHVPPFWVIVLAGSLLGYLIVGGVLWFIRIAGTLGFGKEAMGMGDVHLMAAVGACLGWIDGTLAFFLSAPVALCGWVVGWAIARFGGSKKGTTLPFGPWLSIATVLVFVLKPLIEWGLTALLHAKPPVNLP